MEVILTEDLYPGHNDPEISTFTYNSVKNKIEGNLSYINSDECIKLAEAKVDKNSIQLIRFRALDPTQPPFASKSQRTADVATLHQVLRILHFPEWPIVAARQDNRLQIGRYYDQFSNDETPVFYGCGSRFCAIWVNYIKERSVRVFMVNFMLPEATLNQYFHQLLLDRILPEFQTCFTHPMFFALAMAHMIELDTMKEYTQTTVNLRRIENSFVTVRSAGRIETMEGLRDLGRSAIIDKYTLITLSKLLGMARRVDAEYFDKGNSQQADLMIKKQFFWHAARLDDTIALDQAFLTSISESVQNQQTALTSIINLQDTSALKTIAIITMTFLPASFVAALFSMSMFQWNEDEGRIVSRQFWIYWAVVLPLTLLVFVTWLVWWNWNWLTTELKEWMQQTLHQKKTANGKPGATNSMPGIPEKDRLSRFEHEYWKHAQSVGNNSVSGAQGV